MTENRIPGQYRQGDVLIERVNDGGKEFQGKPLEPDDRGRTILARGEATGHDHALKSSCVADVIETDNDEIIFAVPEFAMVHHQEHSPITLETGRYMATVQQEYTPREIRRVAD